MAKSQTGFKAFPTRAKNPKPTVKKKTISNLKVRKAAR